jgi:hypothetical protein
LVFLVFHYGRKALVSSIIWVQSKVRVIVKALPLARNPANIVIPAGFKPESSGAAQSMDRV